MQLFQQRFNYSNNVSTLCARTITLAPSARRRAVSSALHPTTLCLILSIAFTQFLTFCKQSETTPDTPTRTTIHALVSLSLLFSMLGALSGALTPCPVIRTIYQHDPAFVKDPVRPAPAPVLVIQSRTNVCMPDVPHPTHVPPWLIQRSRAGLYPLVCILASLSCFAAQVWLSICMYQPFFVQVISGFAAATALSLALRYLRTSFRFILWTC